MNRTLIFYLTSYALSLLGNSIAAIALPLIVLQATGSIMSAGILAVSTAVPAFLAGMLAGVVIDRINRRTASAAADVISAVSLAALPVVDAFTGLGLGWFIVFGILGAVGDMPGLTAWEWSAGHDFGPAAAGGLMVFFEGSTVLWITAGTSLAAAAVPLLTSRPQACGPRRRRGRWAQWTPKERPEPERGYNGYHNDETRDLIRLLRIKRLGAIGIPLDAMAELDELEVRIDAEMDLLQRRKRLITGLSTARALELPPELAQVVDALAASAPASVRQMDREQAILLAHLAGEDGVNSLAEDYGKLSHRSLPTGCCSFTPTLPGSPREPPPKSWSGWLPVSWKQPASTGKAH